MACWPVSDIPAAESESPPAAICRSGAPPGCSSFRPGQVSFCRPSATGPLSSVDFPAASLPARAWRAVTRTRRCWSHRPGPRVLTFKFTGNLKLLVVLPCPSARHWQANLKTNDPRTTQAALLASHLCSRGHVRAVNLSSTQGKFDGYKSFTATGGPGPQGP